MDEEVDFGASQRTAMELTVGSADLPQLRRQVRQVLANVTLTSTVNDAVTVVDALASYALTCGDDAAVVRVEIVNGVCLRVEVDCASAWPVTVSPSDPTPRLIDALSSNHGVLGHDRGETWWAEIDLMPPPVVHDL